MKKQVLSLLLILLFPAISLAQGSPSLRFMMEELGSRYGMRFVYESGLSLDRPYSGPELSGTDLRRDLRLLFKGSGLTWTVDGHYISLRGRRRTNIRITPSVNTVAGPVYDTLAPAMIASNQEAPADGRMNSGFIRFPGWQVDRSFAFLGSPDVFRLLWAQPGVTRGADLSTGLFVRGGEGIDNLYMLDGVPIYQVEHLFGLFSTFNTDVLDRIDFYKGAFPARFGGAVSSILDVTTRDGDFDRICARVSLGTIDGRFQIEGPLIRGKTSFNLSARRSWADAMLVPVLHFARRFHNKANAKYAYDGHYGFADVNAKLTHRFSSRSILSAHLYSGSDDYCLEETISAYYQTIGTRPSWSNLLFSMAWDYRPDDRVTIHLIPYFSRYRSSYQNTYLYDIIQAEGPITAYESYEESHARLRSDIDDYGIATDFTWKVHPSHTIRMGFSARYRDFLPEHWVKMKQYLVYRGHEIWRQEAEQTDSEAYAALEGALYLEASSRFSDHIRMNVGLRGVSYAVQRTLRARLEPRFSVEYHASDHLAVDFAYTAMNQFSYCLQTQYYDLPAMIWMPSNAWLEPLHADQFSLGCRMDLPTGISLRADTWYKYLTHLYEYSGARSLLPPFPGLPQRYAEGEGRSYGAEITFLRNTKQLELNANYTLSWNQRYFRDIYPQWFRDRHDNRHSIFLETTWHAFPRIDFNASWTYHSGDRVTLPAALDYANLTRNRPAWLFGAPFNVKLPDYHRLDLCFRFHRLTRHAREESWNLSIYNVYCRMNAISASLIYNEALDVHTAVSHGVLPILPALSYSLTF